MTFPFSKSISRAFRAQRKIGKLVEIALKVPRGKTRSVRHTAYDARTGALEDRSTRGILPRGQAAHGLRHVLDMNRLQASAAVAEQRINREEAYQPRDRCDERGRP